MPGEFDTPDDNAGEKIEMENLVDEMVPAGGVLDATEKTPLIDNVDAIREYSKYSIEQEKIESLYEHFKKEGYEVDKCAFLSNEELFEVINGKLTLKYKNKTIDLTYKDDKSKFIARSTLASRTSEDFVKNDLGIKKKPEIPQPIEAQAIVVNQALPKPGENIPMQDLGGVGDQVSESSEELKYLLHDTVSDPDFTTNNLLLKQSLHDLETLLMNFKSINDQIKIATKKLSGLDKQIKQLKAEKK